MRIDVSAKERKNTTNIALYSLADKLVRESAILKGLLATQIRHELMAQNRNVSSYCSNAIDQEGTHPTLMDRYHQEGFSSNSEEEYLQRRSLSYIGLQKTIEEYFEVRNSIYVTDEIVYDFYNRLIESSENKASDDAPVLIWPDNTTEAEKVIFILQSHYFITAEYGKEYRIIARLIMESLLAKIEGYGLWTISRGLNTHSAQYEKYLSIHEVTQEGEFWNRGYLSKENANNYIKFMLEVALEQVNYVKEHITIDKIYQNIQTYTLPSAKGPFDRDSFSKDSQLLMKELLLLGEIRRGDVASIINKKSRTATSLIKRLTDMGLITSSSPKGPIRIKFNIHFTSHLFPGLIR